jgi:ribonuclease P protein component
MPAAPRKESLSRRHRFSERGAFGRLFGGARRIKGASSLLLVSPGMSEASRFGIAVTKRVAKLAVVRNRIKRAAREAFRKHSVKTAGVDLVLVVNRLPGGDFRDELAALLRSAAQARKS